MGIAIAVFLVLILSVGNYGPFGPIGIVQGDYNSSFNHTRTPIFTDIAFKGPTTGAITFNGETFACVNGGTSLTLPGLAGFTTGDNAIVIILGVGVFNAFSISDSMGLSYTERVFSLTGNGGGSSSYIFTSTPSGSGNNVVTITTGGASRVFCAEAMDYSNIQGFGNTGTFQNDNTNSASGSASVTISFTSGSTGIDALAANGFTPPNPTFAAPSQTQRDQQTGNNPLWIIADKASLSGSTTLTLSWSGGGVGTGVSASMSGLEFKGAAGVTNFQKVRWNYNTTCVTTGGLITFDYSKGVSGATGNNCSSADIAISKSPANLQVAAGRMLEMVTGWNNAANTKPLNVTFVLRTNATLPSFTQTYNPFQDIQSRLIWSICPSFSSSCSGQTVYISRDNTKSIFTETPPNDLVIQGGQPFFNATNIPFENQVVLNFTGPTNFMGSFTGSQTTSTSNNTASGLQFGQDYYVLVMANFNTASAPCGSCTVGFISVQTIAGAGTSPRSFGMFSVPSSCTDPVNKTPCSLPAAQPVFQFNPLDPSSWGNAIIKGLLWVFTVAVPSGLSLVVSVVLAILQAVLNQIGAFIGWGNIGDQFFSFAAGVVTYFTTGLSDAIGWLLRLILRSIDLIKVANFWVGFYLQGLLNFLADLLNVISEFVVFGTKIVTFLGSSYVLIMILFFLWYDADEGLEGWYNWFETTKWFAFISFDFLERMINFGISSITWLFGRIPTLDGTTLPELPTIAIGGGPHFPTFEMRALKEGNFAALFGQLLGVGFLVWFETSGLPGSIGSNVTGTAAGVAAPFVNILLILISVMGLLFILNIPAQLARGVFDLNSVTKIESFRTTSSRAGGVSGHLTRKHPERKARIVVNRGLGVRGFVPHLRRSRERTPESQATA